MPKRNKAPTEPPRAMAMTCFTAYIPLFQPWRFDETMNSMHAALLHGHTKCRDYHLPLSGRPVRRRGACVSLRFILLFIQRPHVGELLGDLDLETARHGRIIHPLAQFLGKIALPRGISLFLVVRVAKELAVVAQLP